jgi:very-short-patch-repair endonuclease/predicted transcriptional regulator of viral defense system
MCGLQQSEHADAVIAALAEAQHGVVSRTQLLEAGLSERQIDHRLRRRRLHVVHRGVYSVGHGAVSPMGQWMAAVLAAGEGGVLSHWSAATLWRMRSGRGPRSHVTSPRQRRRAATITFHHAHLAPDEVTEEQSIPVTTPARTLLDLAPRLPSPTLARMVEAAPNRGASLAELVERHAGRAGVRKLSDALAKPGYMTRSDFEARVLEAIERAGLPRPQVNTVVEGYEVDLVWREHRVIAELDSYVTHGSRTAFERDRERDRRLAIAGWSVARITDDDGVEDLSRLLAATAARSRSRLAPAA